MNTSSNGVDPLGMRSNVFDYNQFTVETRWTAGILVCATAAALSSNLIHRRKVIRVSIAPPEILANGYDTATLAIEGNFPRVPGISFSENSPRASIVEMTRADDRWLVRIRSGVQSGRLIIRAGDQGTGPTAELVLRPDSRDRISDGTPDFLRLDSEHDRESFRRWFTYLAEAQYFRPAGERPREIDDCAALIRYAYREALHTHDGVWANSLQLTTIPAFDSVEKYAYPFTPVGAGLFRVTSGSFEWRDASNGNFLQFADVRTLWRYNTHQVSRSLDSALAGDLLFYRQEGARVTFHSMIYLGPSQLNPDNNRYVVYHTGPERLRAGEIKRLTVGELLRYPQAEWRPIANNPNFLGVFRWNILASGNEVLDARAY